ncbi:MAG: GSCFA domain-containing protein, partial [Bacteroidales bacterium]
MLYYTPVDISKPPKTITHQDPIVFFGSCFSTYIAQKLKWYLFNVLDNPFGILYNPSSIEQCILIIKEKKEIKAEHFFLEDDIYKSFYFHSQWAHTNLEFLLDKVNKMILDSHQFLLQSKWVFITLGTAYVYELKENNQVVANCHKQNAQMFNHRMLSVEEVVDKLNKIYTYILDLSPNANIVFTVSPVRYLKQGAHLNQISKSTLLLA